MKQLNLVVFFLLLTPAFAHAQAIAVNTDASNPDPSAILDVKSTNKGVLVPRMDKAQRELIDTPATGLLVFDTGLGSFWFYDGTAWTNLIAGFSTFIADTDGDTKIQVEKNPDEDILRVNLAGSERLVLKRNATNRTLLELPNNNNNILIGASAGNAMSTGVGNIALGTAALYANTDRSELVAVGDSALYNNGIGASAGFEAVRNTAVGSMALFSNTTGHSNTAHGFHTLELNTTGDNNTASGRNVLASNTSGNANTANGANTLFSNTSGSSNVAIGMRALYNNTDRSNLVAVGDSALYNNGVGAFFTDDAIRNTAVGSKALFSNTTGKYNTAMGQRALVSNTTGNFNTANGAEALYANTTGDYNTAIGMNALSTNTTGSYNTAIGYRALDNLSLFDFTGSNNTAVGWYALISNIFGDNNTGLGFSANVSNNSLSNATAIGNEAIVNGNNRVVIGSNTAGMVIGGYASWSNLSDGRFKEDVRENVPGLDFISRLRPVTYWINTDKLQRHITAEMPDSIARRYLPDAEQQAKDRAYSHTGFVAQEVEAVARAIGYAFDGVNAPQNPTDNYSIAYSQFVPSLVKAVQEQQTLIEAQAEKIETQQAELEQVKKQVAENAALRAQMEMLKTQFDAQSAQLQQITAALKTAGVGAAEK